MPHVLAPDRLEAEERRVLGGEADPVEDLEIQRVAALGFKFYGVEFRD